MPKITSPLRTRTDIIAAFNEAKFADVPPKPTTPTSAVPDPTTPADPAKPADPTDPAAPATSPVGDALAKIKADAAAAQALQAKEPDVTTDPNDVKVTAAIQALQTAVDAAIAAETTDAAGDKAADPTKPADPVPPAKPPVPPAKPAPANLSVVNTAPVTNQMDDQGNVDNDAQCTTQGCGHLAAAHADTDTGANTGPCSMAGCVCQELTLGDGTMSDPEGDDSDGQGGVEENVAPAPNGGAHAGPVISDAPGGSGAGAKPADGVAEAPTPLAPQDANPAPVIPGGMDLGPAFTIPVGVIEGQETGDGRGIALEALEWGTGPWPLMGLATATHDPMGFDMNDPSVLCGRIDSLTRAGGEQGTQIISAKGNFLSNDDGMYFADLIGQMGRVGISADISVDEAEETITGMDEFGWPIFASTLTKGTVQGFTVVPFPAFEGAYIILGDGTTVPDIPQKVAEQLPVPASVTAGGNLVHYMAPAECEPCMNGIDVLVASGGPVKPPKAWFLNPMFAEGDGRLKEIFTGRGAKKVGGQFACPQTITEDGEVYGHLAPWSVCHSGFPGQCVTAPSSKANYAHFLRDGQKVMTAEGEQVTVGVLTFHGGHASSGRGLSPAAAMAHYDNTATAWADVVTGEDAYGVWFHGAVRPSVTDEQLREVRSASLSGDWREIGGNLELVAVLSVNQPGFPVSVVADGRPVSLVAAGTYQMAELTKEPDVEIVTPDSIWAAVRPVMEAEKSRLRQQKLEMQKRHAQEAFNILKIST
jgi:hypothetical protein